MDAAFEWRLKKMKRVIAVILVLCMALSLCACSSSGSGSASGEKVIKIGVFEPSSGDSASGGKKEILGMQYANSQEPTVTLGGETYKVELVYGDNGSSTDKAPSRCFLSGQRGRVRGSGFLRFRRFHGRRPQV